MQRWLAIGVAVILLVAGGYIWTRGSAPRGAAIAAAPAAAAGGPAVDTAPLVAPVSDVTPADREARRFERYDKDKDGAVTRDEYLLSRHKAYARLDLDGNGNLSFDEYAVRATKKFITADLNRDKQLAATEFATTAVKRRARTTVDCPPVAAEADAEREG